MKKFLTLIVLATLIYGCDNSTDTPATSEQIFPLKIGNRFIYLNEHYDYNTAVLDSTTIDTIMITSSKSVGGETYYSMTFRSVNRLPDSAYAVNRSDGFWTLTDKGFTQIVKYPANVGDSWGGDSAYVNDKVVWRGKWVLKAKDEPVSVTAGIFKCYRYELDLVDSIGTLYRRNIDWYSPSNGLIKSEEYYNSPGNYHLIWRMSLTDLDLK